MYIAYEDCKLRFERAYQKYNEILAEKEALFQRTQIQAVDYSKDKVSSSAGNNPFESYIVEKERLKIDERLSEAKSIMEDRAELLRAKEAELRASKGSWDRVYCMARLDKKPIWWIARKINYSKSQVYRILRKIDASLKDATKCD